MNWEYIVRKATDSVTVKRLKVPGGWIYAVDDTRVAQQVKVLFIPETPRQSIELSKIDLEEE